MLKCLWWCQAWMCKQPVCFHLMKIINDSVKQQQFCIGLLDWKCPIESKAVVERSSATFFSLRFNCNYYCSQSHIPEKQREGRRIETQRAIIQSAVSLLISIIQSSLAWATLSNRLKFILFICRHTCIDTMWRYL